MGSSLQSMTASAPPSPCPLPTGTAGMRKLFRNRSSRCTRCRYHSEYRVNYGTRKGPPQLRNRSKITTVSSVPLVLPSPQRGEGTEEVIFPTFLSFRERAWTYARCVHVTRRMGLSMNTLKPFRVVRFRGYGVGVSERFSSRPIVIVIAQPVRSDFTWRDICHESRDTHCYLTNHDVGARKL